MHEESGSRDSCEDGVTNSGVVDVLYSEAQAILIRTRLRHAEQSSGQGLRAEQTQWGSLACFRRDSPSRIQAQSAVPPSPQLEFDSSQFSRSTLSVESSHGHAKSQLLAHYLWLTAIELSQSITNRVVTALFSVPSQSCDLQYISSKGESTVDQGSR